MSDIKSYSRYPISKYLIGFAKPKTVVRYELVGTEKDNIAPTQALDVCVAHEHSDYNYISSVQYWVTCGTGTHETKPSIFFIPFTAYQRAKKNLDKEMQAGSYKQVSVIKKPAESIYSGLGDFFVFKKDPVSNASYCLAVKFDKKVIGVNQATIVFKYDIKCDGKQIPEAVYSGITQTELVNQMEKNGYQQLIDSNTSFYGAYGLSLFMKRE